MQATADTLVSEVVLNVMKKRVLFTDKKTGKQETPLDAYTRAARFVAKGHEVYSCQTEANKFADKAIEMMASGYFMPNTPTLVNAGFPKAQCAACFVVPVADQLNDIYSAHYQQGLIQASGGGTGFYLGDIRRKGALAGERFVTRGPINWLQMFNENATHVAQGMREGANIATLDVSHPDIVEFITCKHAGYKLRVAKMMEDLGVDQDTAARIKSIIGIEKFNLSVSITDLFMAHVEEDQMWSLVDPHTREIAGKIRARELWDLIISNAWEHGEPGLFFVDTVNKGNYLPHIGYIRAPNPCGENPLLPYESCTMGHINLAKLVRGINGSSHIDWQLFEDLIRFGVQFLDDVVEINQFPIPQLADMNKNTRRIGLGVMGWADMLALTGTAYDSDDAIKMAHKVGEFFKNTALSESERLGKDRGNFPYFEGSRFQKEGYTHMRNSNTTTIAPTGQTAMYVGGVEGGIEPMHYPVKQREQAGMVQTDYQPTLFKVLQAHDLDTQELRRELVSTGSCRHSKLLPESIKHAFPSAHDIDFRWHVKHQIAWQTYISSAVSKTINLPRTATKAEVAEAYMMAYQGGCKGVTVYRDGSREHQPISKAVEVKAKATPVQPNVNNDIVPVEALTKANRRSAVTHGSNRKVACGCGNLMIYAGSNGDKRIQEITARLGKGGGCSSAQTEAIARMASVAMQYGAPPELVASQLGGIRCHLTAYHSSPHTGKRPRTVTSCGDAISVALSEHLAEMHGTAAEFKDADEHTGACPECGGQLTMSEGCRGGKCTSCGFSKCG